MKYTKLIATLSAIILSFGFGLMVAQAQSYTPLAPLPGTFVDGTAGATTNISLYVSGLIKLLIALGAALALLFAIIGGTQYVAASINPSAKADALGKVQNALIGLAIILTSYLLLNSINPTLVNVNFNLPPVETAGRQPVDGIVVVPSGVGMPWGSDASERAQLGIGVTGSGITTNHPNGNCQKVGEQNCTSLTGLGQKAISGLTSLRDGCKALKSTGCSVTITGGTEYWLHSQKTAHRPGGNVIDLSKTNGALNNYITTKGVHMVSSDDCAPGDRYKIGNAVYVDEKIAGNPPHWHVCYY